MINQYSLNNMQVTINYDDCIQSLLDCLNYHRAIFERSYMFLDYDQVLRKLHYLDFLEFCVESLLDEDAVLFDFVHMSDAYSKQYSGERFYKSNYEKLHKDIREGAMWRDYKNNKASLRK